MKKLISAAAAACLVAPTALIAGGHEGDGGGGPPQAVKTTINLGGSGLLTPFFANSQKGTTSARGGQDSTRGGNSAATGRTTGYKHENFTFIPSISGSKMIQQGTAFLTFGIGTNIGNEQPNQTEFDTQINGFSLGYENFSDPNAAWSLGLAFDSRETEGQGSPVTSEEDSVELRFAYTRKLNDTWGVANQTYFTRGENTVTTPGGATTEPGTEIYTQFEVVGNFGPDQVGFVPDGWKLHPTFGVSFQRATTETDAGDEVAEDGSVWAKAQLAKGVRPGAWIPNYTLGLEHVYQTDTGDIALDEDTYLIVGAGAQYLAEKGSFVVSFERRQGFNGNRIHNTLVAGYTFDF